MTGATPGETAALTDADGKEVATDTVDAFGNALFHAAHRRRLRRARRRHRCPIRSPSRPTTAPGSRCTPARTSNPGTATSRPRDGTTCRSTSVAGPADQGPYPSVVEYSGYDPSNPRAASPPSGAQLLGFASVGVNLRGTGCSGGAYNFFEDLSRSTATTPSRPSPRSRGAGRTVGMVGISFPGISQLFVASPPAAPLRDHAAVRARRHLRALPRRHLQRRLRVGVGEGSRGRRPSHYAWEARDRDGPASGSPTATNVSHEPGAAAAVCRRAAGDPRLPTPRAASDALHPRARPRHRRPGVAPGAWQDQETGSHFANMLATSRPTSR